MPRGDGTGPMGTGPMTGRAAGYCAGFETPGYANAFPGRGFGMGYGRGRGARGGLGGGRGWRHRFYATGLPGWMRYGGDAAPFARRAPDAALAPEDERDALKHQAEALEAAIAGIKQRLSELEAGAAAK